MSTGAEWKVRLQKHINVARNAKGYNSCTSNSMSNGTISLTIAPQKLTRWETCYGIPPNSQFKD